MMRNYSHAFSEYNRLDMLNEFLSIESFNFFILNQSSLEIFTYISEIF